MLKGKVVASLTNSLTSMTWYSEEQAQKKFMRKGINLRIEGEGFFPFTGRHTYHQRARRIRR